jgi:glycosyltransferase involved in cell wall biosynthesis
MNIAVWHNLLSGGGKPTLYYHTQGLLKRGHTIEAWGPTTAGFPPLEANVCGLPVGAVAEGGVRETVVDGINGLLVEPDEKAMASAIERLRNDKDLAYRLDQNGRRLVAEKWSSEASIDRIERRLERFYGTLKNETLPHVWLQLPAI